MINAKINKIQKEEIICTIKLYTNNEKKVMCKSEELRSMNKIQFPFLYISNT